MSGTVWVRKKSVLSLDCQRVFDEIDLFHEEKGQNGPLFATTDEAGISLFFMINEDLKSCRAT